MYRTCFCLITVLGVACAASAANLGYLPRQTQKLPQAHYGQAQAQAQALAQAPYFYNVPQAASTMAALRRIVLGHLQRFQQADRQRALASALTSELTQRQPYRLQLAPAASQQSLDYAVPPNTPTPKNYAMNFLPEGKDVAPGTSYIPLKLLRIRR